MLDKKNCKRNEEYLWWLIKKDNIIDVRLGEPEDRSIETYLQTKMQREKRPLKTEHLRTVGHQKVKETTKLSSKGPVPFCICNQ